MTQVVGQSNHSYGDLVNSDFLKFIGPVNGIVVDIGSGRGAWAPNLRAAGAERLVAIEPSDDAAVAEKVYDEVFRGTCQEMPSGLVADAGLLIAADVLEHLPDPWATLRDLRGAVAPGTRLAISTPNVQCARYLLLIMLTGKFTYSDDGGWLDRGHLRWFSRRTLTADLKAAGWSVKRADGKVLGRFSQMLYRLTGGRARDLAFYQLHIMAVAA